MVKSTFQQRLTSRFLNANYMERPGPYAEKPIFRIGEITVTDTKVMTGEKKLIISLTCASPGKPPTTEEEIAPFYQQESVIRGSLIAAGLISQTGKPVPNLYLEHKVRDAQGQHFILDLNFFVKQ